MNITKALYYDSLATDYYFDDVEFTIRCGYIQNGSDIQEVVYFHDELDCVYEMINYKKLIFSSNKIYSLQFIFQFILFIILT